MNTKKKILLQCQSLTYLYFGLASVLTKYSVDEVDIDVFLTKRDASEEFLNYIKMNRSVKNLYTLNSAVVDKINRKLSKLNVSFLNKVYYDKVYKKYIAYKFREQLNKNEYSEIFYSEGSQDMIYLSIAYPDAHFVMYGDGSGLIYNPSNSKLIMYFDGPLRTERLYSIKHPDEIISLAPYKKDESINIEGVPVSATSPKILLDIIKRDMFVQGKVNDFAKYIQNECINYDKRILLLPSRLEDQRFRMTETDQVDIYVDIISKYSTENSLVILKPHPTSKVDLTSVLKERCNCEIMDIPDDLKVLPVEIYTELLAQMDHVITFLSSARVAIKALYDIDGIDCYDIIQNYPLKERVNIDLKVYQEVFERYKSWDKKSIIYECNVIPQHAEFYKKYPRPVYNIRKNTLLENIFSVRNINAPDKKRKQITMLGIKIKM